MENCVCGLLSVFGVWLGALLYQWKPHIPFGIIHGIQDEIFMLDMGN